MQFLVELDHVQVRRANVAGSRPVLHRASDLSDDRASRAPHCRTEHRRWRSLSGRIALRLIVQAESASHADQLVTSVPHWPLAETRITPLISFAERREHAQKLLENLIPRG